MKSPNLILIFSLFCFLLLMGCVEENQSIPGIPFTVGQFISKVTTTDYNSWVSGDLNGKVLFMDWNKIGFMDANFSGGGGSGVWSDLTGFPSGCGAGEAVQVIGTTLTCIPIGGSYSDANTLAVINSLDLNNSLNYLKTYVDTNRQTAGFATSTDAQLQDFNVNRFNLVDVNGIKIIDGNYAIYKVGNDLWFSDGS
jgi:hypothetical protein